MCSQHLPHIFINSCICPIHDLYTKSNTILGGLIHQGGKTKYDGVFELPEKSMLEAVKNCLIWRSKVGMAFSLASDNLVYLLSNTTSCVGCLGSDLILVAYCRYSFIVLASTLGLCASTYKHSTDGLNVQRQSLRPWLCTDSERNVLFNDALNTFYLRLYGVRHMVKDHSDSEKGNPLPPHRLLLSINSKGSFICNIPQTG